MARGVEGEEALDEEVGRVLEQDLLLDADVELLLALLLAAPPRDLDRLRWWRGNEDATMMVG